jgi:ParB family transcriptional regulator, chromosome partitioning protein
MMITTENGNGSPETPPVEKPLDFLYIPISQILVGTQIRETIDTRSASFLSLVESIRLRGLLEPLVVSHVGVDYHLLAGERRLRACKDLGWSEVPVRILEGITAQDEIMAIQLTENLQREDLNPIEEASAYLHYVQSRHPELDLAGVRNLVITYATDPGRVTTECASTLDAVTNISCKSIGSLRNSLSTLLLPPELQEAMKEGKLSLSQGYIFSDNLDHPQLMEIFRTITAKPVTNEGLRRLLARLKPKDPATQAKGMKPVRRFQLSIRNVRKGIAKGLKEMDAADLDLLIQDLRALTTLLEEYKGAGSTPP